MFNQNGHEYTLKGSFLEMKRHYGELTRRLSIKVTEFKSDADFDLLEKYQKDLAKFKLNLLQIEESCADFPDKANEIKEKRNYDRIQMHYTACQEDFENDRQAQRQKKLEDDLYSEAVVDIASDEKFTMGILRNILNGEIDKLVYDLVFAMEVLTAFFIFVKANHPLLKNIEGNTTNT
jgi:hypothetical protein